VIVQRDRPGVLLSAPCWSPDGSGLVFESVAVTSTGAPQNSVDWVSVSGSGRRAIAVGGRFPGVSPDGSQIVFVRSAPAGDGLFVQPLSGGAERRILPDDRQMAITTPRFSPDGTTIAFAGVEPYPLGMTKRAPLSPLTSRPDAHGLLADPYIVSRTGTDLRRVAQLAV
jgi:Tol biopolymer transport system component